MSKHRSVLVCWVVTLYACAAPSAESAAPSAAGAAGQSSVSAPSPVITAAPVIARQVPSAAPPVVPNAMAAVPARPASPPPSAAAPVIPPAASPPPSAAASNAAPAPGGGCLKGVGDYTMNGPYTPAMMDVTVGDSGQFTVFYPEPLDPSCKHPIVAWGNGTGVMGSQTYSFYHNHAASWGIVVIASHHTDVGNGSWHKAGIDYLLAQSKDPASKFFERLSDKAGTSGHSQGGMGANQGATHPNVKAEVNVQGAFTAPPGMVAYLCLTGTEDINPEGCKSSVMQARGPAMHANWNGADHIQTAAVGGYFSRNPGTMMYMRLYTSWFRCFLDDDNACAIYRGAAMCPVCADPGWAEVFTKNF